MKLTMLEPLLRDATIKAIDTISTKAKKAEHEAETMVGKLLNKWNSLSANEKENVVGIVIATASAAVTAVAAARAAKKPRKMAKKVVKKVARKLT